MAETGNTTDRNEARTAGQSLPAAIQRRVAVARLVLWWERAWPALWPPVGTLTLYASLALVGLFDSLPLALAWLTLAIALAATFYLAARGHHAFAWPTGKEALRRLETMNKLPHRPVSTYADQAATGTGSPRLWAAHRKWLNERIAALKISLPTPGLAARDPFALRAALLLCLVISFVVAGPDAGNRLAQGFFPGFTDTGAPGRLDTWITPPAYTGKAPSFLSRGHADALEVPQGSELTAQLFGGTRPVLALGSDILTFERRRDGGETGYNASAILDKDVLLTITQGGRELGRWELGVIPDLPPQVRLLEQVNATRRRTLRFLYEVNDDYGVTALHAAIALDPVFVLEDKPIFHLGDDDHQRAGFSPLIDGFVAERIDQEIGLPLPGLRPKDATHTAYKDLTAHPWAGLPVTLELVAKDDAGQEGRSRTVSLSLPARSFEKPLAAAIIEQRRRLALSPRNRGSVAGFLNAFTLDAETRREDLSVFLGLRAAYWRLVKARHPGDLDGVSDMLWDLALHIEDGDLSIAERDLRAAREDLMQALADGASPDEIELLMQDLKLALARYLDELSQQAAGDGQPAQPRPGDSDGEMVERSDLENMLDAIGDLARTGARNQAQDLLAQLDEILENLDTQAGDRQLTPGENALSETIGEMGEMIDRQRNLMDETFQHGQGANAGSQGDDQAPRGQGEEGAPPLSGLREQQQALRERLVEMMGELGENGHPIPGGLDRAARAMEQAEDRLAQGRADSATGAQGQAIDLLRQGAQALADAMFEAMSESGEQGSAESGGGQVDPLGRPLSPSGRAGAENVTVPEELELQRARQILEELRKRAAELGRSQDELDYLERLLRRF